MKIFKLTPEEILSNKDLRAVVALLKKGGVVVVPTDTSYGLSALVTKKKGIDRVFRLKGRSKKKSVSMAVRSRSQASEYGEISCRPTILWRKFLPGPLTLVVAAKKRGLHKLLVKNSTIAVRLVPMPVVDQLLRALGVPITITSANKAGKGDVYSYQEFIKHYKKGPLPDAFIDAGRLRKRKPSTVVRFDKDNNVEILRKGPITIKQIAQILK